MLEFGFRFEYFFQIKFKLRQDITIFSNGKINLGYSLGFRLLHCPKV